MKEDRKSDSRCDKAELFRKRREEYKREKRSQGNKKAELNTPRQGFTSFAGFWYPAKKTFVFH